MSFMVTLLFGDKIYYSTCEYADGFRIGSEGNCNLVIPDLGYGLLFSRLNGSYQLKISAANGSSRIEEVINNMSTVIDFDRQIAVFLTENSGRTTTVKMPRDCEIRIGKNDSVSADGRRNDIVLDLPFVSRNHCRIIRKSGNTTVIDTNSKNGIFVNGERVKTAELHDGDLLSILTVQVRIHGDQLVFKNTDDVITVYKIRETDTRKAAPIRPTQEENYKFSRAPRLVQDIESETIELEQPPKASGEPQINWLNVLITPLVSVGLMLILVFAMGMNAVMLIMSGVMSVFSAIVAVVTYKKQKAQHGETDEKIDEKYHAYLDSVSKRIEDAHGYQLQSLIASNPSPQSCLSIVCSKGRQLWERRPNDPDFLVVRLGIGTIFASVTASFRQSQVIIEENKLESEASDLAAKSKTITNAPILCSLLEKKQTGLLGNRRDEILLTRNMITELATAHAYDELKIILLVPEQEKEEWAWVRWLPHCSDNKQTRRYFFTSLEDAQETLDEIEETLSRRKNESADYRETDRSELLPHYLFIVAAPSYIDKHSIRKYVYSDAELGCSALFICNKLNSLPKECDQIIETNGDKGNLFVRTQSSKKTPFQFDVFSKEDADRFSRCMAPLFTETEKTSASIPTSVSFLEGYHVSRPEELNISERWGKARTFKTLSVPIAATAGGGVFEFDIHEKRHGVNGIVAGMPGSGKTEMVQSWLLSLAVNYSPQDVSFVLIDFKGTGMIAPFRDLPHVAGTISNLDTNIDRNLIAIQSEVHRREAIIDKYSNRSIKNVNDLNRSYAQGLVPEKLPILLIVIDEYAEFKKVFPDFGAEVDSLTSKGRALGIFVILMTQKPAGVVSSKSEDNIKFRWCLRVANYSASREMLGKPDAAKINNPGRAYIKVGEDDVFEEVQSFWSGAPYDPEKGSRESSFVPISRVEWNGRHIPCEQIEKRENEAAHEAEIDVVVRYVADYCKRNNIPEADKVWTARLPDRLALSDVMKKGFNGRKWPDTEKAAPTIGLIDEPADQRQYPFELDFAKLGHTVIYGAPVTGKTTLLQTLIVSLSLIRKPNEASIYIMDFGGWNMSVFKDLPHVGGIANDNEPERLKKLMLLLSDILQERKEKFSRAGVGNITAYRETCAETIPDVFLIVDNFGSMIKMYPDMDSFFITLTNSGANYGVYLVATATATNAVPMKISQNIKNALALQMIEKSDYTYTVGRVSGELPPVMGRGYAKGNPPLEFQTALPAPGDDDKTVSDNIKKIAEYMRRAWDGDLPAMIPEMPETITYGSVKTKGIALGLSVDKVQPVVFDITTQHYLLISGTEQSGKSSLLQVVARQIKEKLGGLLYVFNIKGDGLNELRAVSDEYLTAAKEIDTFVEGLRPELQRRHTAKKNDPGARFEPIILAVDDFTAFYKAINNDTAQRLLAIVKIGKGLDLYLAAAGDAYELTGFFNKGEALTLAMGKARQAVMLGGCMNDHGAIQAKASYSQKSVPVREHEGIFVSDAQNTVFQVMDIKEGQA